MGRYQKFPHGDKGNFRIRDYTANDGEGKWVSDANGRQYRTNEERTDEIIKELEEREED